MGPIARATVLVAALLVAGCTGTAAVPVDDAQDPVDRIGLAAEVTPHRDPRLVRVARLPRHLDPQRVVDATERDLVQALLHRTLVAYPAAGPGGPAPDLAVEPGRASTTAKTWTYTLRPGLRFEDGTPLTARDVRYGVSRLFAPELHGGVRPAAAALFAVPQGYPGPYRATPAQRRAFERAIVVSPDGATITFHLARPVPDFDRWAARLELAPVPAPADPTAGYDRHPLATGPYRVDRVVAGVSIVLSRNPVWSPALDPLRSADARTVVVLAGRGRTATP